MSSFGDCVPTDYNKLREACPLLEENDQDKDNFSAADRETERAGRAESQAASRVFDEMVRDGHYAKETSEQRIARLHKHPLFARARAAAEAAIDRYQKLFAKEVRSKQTMEQAALEAQPELNETYKQGEAARRKIEAALPRDERIETYE